MRQFFVNEKLELHARYTFEDDQAHHIARVLRMKNQDRVRLVDADGRVYLGELVFNNGNVEAEITEALTQQEQGSEVIVMAALIKKDKWELLLQKAAELGATRIVPLVTARTIIRLEEQEISKKLDRWNKITLEACQQSNRNDLCEVVRPVTLNQIEEYKADLNLVAYENEDTVRLSEALGLEGSVAVAIGPEGGWERKEIDFLLSQGFKSVSLGPRILRAETAVFYALSVIGELR